jgi:hypothetical protein
MCLNVKGNESGAGSRLSMFPLAQLEETRWQRRRVPPRGRVKCTACCLVATEHHVTNRVKERPKTPSCVFIRGEVARGQCTCVGKQIEPVLGDELRPLGASITVPWLRRVVPGSRPAWLIPTSFPGLCGTCGPIRSWFVSKQLWLRTTDGETSFREYSVHNVQNHCNRVAAK